MLTNVIDYGSEEDLEHLLEHFIEYLSDLGNTDEIKTILTSYPYVENKVRRRGISELLGDFSINDLGEEVQLIRNALSLSQGDLQDHPELLSIYLVGRLLNIEATKTFSQKIINYKRAAQKPFLKATKTNLSMKGKVFNEISKTTERSFLRSSVKVRVSPNLKYVASNHSDENRIDILDAQTFRIEKNFSLGYLKGRNFNINKVFCFISDTSIAYVQSDKTLIVWNFETDTTKTYELPLESNYIMDFTFDFHSNNFYFLTSNKQIVISNPQLEILRVVGEGVGEYFLATDYRVTISSYGTFLVISSSSARATKPIQLINHRLGVQIPIGNKHFYSANSFCFSRDEKTLFLNKRSSNYDENMTMELIYAINTTDFSTNKVFSLNEEGEIGRLMHLGKSDIASIAVDKDNKYLFGISMNGNIIIWDIDTGEIVNVHGLDEGLAKDDVRSLINCSIEITDDNQVMLYTDILFGSGENSLSTLQTSSVEALLATKNKKFIEKTVEGITFVDNDTVAVYYFGQDPFGESSYSNSKMYYIELFNVKTGVLVSREKSVESKIHTQILHEGLRFLAFQDGAKTFSIIDNENGTSKVIVSPEELSKITSVSVHQSLCITTHLDKKVLFWDYNSGILLKTYIGELEMVQSFISEDGKWIVLGDKVGEVHIFQFENTEELFNRDSEA